MEGTLTRGKKWASGTAVRSQYNDTFMQFYNSGVRTTKSYYIEVEGLDFKPSTVIITNTNGFVVTAVCVNPINATNSNYYAIAHNNYIQSALTHPASLHEGGFKLPIGFNEDSKSYTWVAYE